MSLSPSRRTVLKGALVLAVLPVAGFTTERRRSTAVADPFTLGVASGEPTPDGVVIWTRLAPTPLADDGYGGMPDHTVDVEWEVADDERFTRIAQRGIAVAAPELAHSVHVELAGLRPGAEYFYRFRAGGHVSPAGRTRTAPALGSQSPLTMCFASCSNYEQGWFTAYRHLAEEHPDLVLHLGDYQYEYAAGQTGDVRRHTGGETVTLADYRRRYAQYKSDLDLQAAHAAAPWLVVFDDHELADNWAGDGAVGTAAGLPRAPGCGVAGLLREHAAASNVDADGAPTCGCTVACAGAAWPHSTCSTPGSTATTRPAATRSATAPSASTPLAR